MSANRILNTKERAAVLSAVLDTTIKSAAVFPDVVNNTLRTAAALSIAAGIPLGVAWHALSSSGKITSNKQRDRLKGIEYYRNAERNINNALS